MDAGQVADRLTEHFGFRHTEDDIIGIREDGNATVAVTAFGNKVRITDDFVAVSTGPQSIAELVPAPEPEAAPDEPQDDLPPLEGVAEEDQEPDEDGNEDQEPEEPAPKPRARRSSK